jgi:hypothetical protein
MEPEGSLPYSQEPATGSCAEPDNPIHTTISYFSKVIFSVILRQISVVPSGLFPHGFLTKTLQSCVLRALPISSSLTWSFELCSAKNTSYEAPHCAVLSSLSLFHPSWVQIFSSAPCSQVPSVCVCPLMSEIKFHAHTESQTKLWLYILTVK